MYALLLILLLSIPQGSVSGTTREVAFEGFTIPVSTFWKKTESAPGELRYAMEGSLGGVRLPPLRIVFRRAGEDLSGLRASEILRRLHAVAVRERPDGAPGPRLKIRALERFGLNFLIAEFPIPTQGEDSWEVLAVVTGRGKPLIFSMQGPEPLLRSQTPALRKLWGGLRPLGMDLSQAGETATGTASRPASTPARKAQELSGKFREERIDVLELQVPVEWKRRTPRSNMRLGEFEVPGPGGTATLAVFHFGPRSGSIQANLDRWKGQFKDPRNVVETKVEGTPLETHWLSIEGTFTSSMRPAGPKDPVPDTRLIAWIVKTDKGPFYFKLVGPSKTVGAWESSIRKTLLSIRQP